MSDLNPLFFLISLALFPGCQSREAVVGDPPEEVVKKYQTFMDANDFAEAGKISTPAEQERLRELAAFISRVNGEEDALPVMESTFLHTDCRQVADTAWCNCLIRDEEGQDFTSKFRLLKVNKHWLMDVPDEEATITEDEIEVIDESLEKNLREEQE